MSEVPLYTGRGCIPRRTVGQRRPRRRPSTIGEAPGTTLATRRENNCKSRTGTDLFWYYFYSMWPADVAIVIVGSVLSALSAVGSIRLDRCDRVVRFPPSEELRVPLVALLGRPAAHCFDERGSERESERERESVCVYTHTHTHREKEGESLCV